jgi:hypothetical protein
MFKKKTQNPFQCLACLGFLVIVIYRMMESVILDKLRVGRSDPGVGLRLQSLMRACLVGRRFSTYVTTVVDVVCWLSASKSQWFITSPSQYRLMIRRIPGQSLSTGRSMSLIVSFLIISRTLVMTLLTLLECVVDAWARITCGYMRNTDVVSDMPTFVGTLLTPCYRSNSLRYS